MTSSQYRSEGQQWASSPPLPHSSSCLAPLALVKLLCWALRLVAENRRGRRFGVTSSPQLYKRLLVPMPACTWTRMLIPRQHSVHAHRHTTFKKKMFLPALNGRWNLSSQTKYRTHSPCSGSQESQPVDYQGSPWHKLLKKDIGELARAF